MQAAIQCRWYIGVFDTDACIVEGPRKSALNKGFGMCDTPRSTPQLNHARMVVASSPGLKV